ncbi:SRPBCC family protein [Occultella aeris]|uniref:Polyketide cyclase / dehydrase and lipid transport n=1 Tax=Occultella aeris TaxID=2761496 RepID=A0A7M4DI55_9MICO|nr:SRPBCC family protein [Occultella aeris]VZO36619.1 Polyketide cyclase / dehydrase and lipid transport [Occultella aeris]
MLDANITVEARIAAPPERVWSLVGDVDRWAEMLPTIDAVQRIDPGAELGLGARLRVRQPGLPPATYEITRWSPGRAFDWVAMSPGVRTVGTHEVRQDGSGDTKLVLGLAWHGPLAGLVRVLLTSRARRYVEQEAAAFTRLAQVPAR